MNNELVNIKLNGESKTLTGECSLLQLLQQQNYQGSHFAVAVNQTFIPRTQHDEYIICNNDAIDIVAPMQGG